MSQPDDLVTAKEILALFPKLPRHALYRLVELKKITAYKQPTVAWRTRTLYLYSVSEVAAALGARPE